MTYVQTVQTTCFHVHTIVFASTQPVRITLLRQLVTGSRQHSSRNLSEDSLPLWELGISLLRKALCANTTQFHMVSRDGFVQSPTAKNPESLRVRGLPLRRLTFGGYIHPFASQTLVPTDTVCPQHNCHGTSHRLCHSQ